MTGERICQTNLLQPWQTSQGNVQAHYFASGRAATAAPNGTGQYDELELITYPITVADTVLLLHCLRRA